MLSEIDKGRQILYELTCEVLKEKEKQLIETDNRLVVARGWGVGEMGRCQSKGPDFPL